MDEDDDFEDEQTVRVVAGVGRLNWTDPFMVGLALVEGVADAVSATARAAAMILGAHSNWVLERQRFAEAVGRDIESLTGRSDA